MYVYRYIYICPCKSSWLITTRALKRRTGRRDGGTGGKQALFIVLFMRVLVSYEYLSLFPTAALPAWFGLSGPPLSLFSISADVGSASSFSSFVHDISLFSVCVCVYLWREIFNLDGWSSNSHGRSETQVRKEEELLENIVRTTAAVAEEEERRRRRKRPSFHTFLFLPLFLLKRVFKTRNK